MVAAAKIEHMVLLESIFLFSVSRRNKDYFSSKGSAHASENRVLPKRQAACSLLTPIGRAAVCHARACVTTARIRTGVDQERTTSA